MGRGLAVPAALPVPPAGACVCSAGDHGLALWVPFFPGGVSLTFYFSKFLLCSLPSPKTRRASSSELSFAFAIRTEQRLSAKSLGFHRFPLATHRNVGIAAAAFAYSSKSLFFPALQSYQFPGHISCLLPYGAFQAINKGWNAHD